MGSNQCLYITVVVRVPSIFLPQHPHPLGTRTGLAKTMVMHFILGVLLHERFVEQCTLQGQYSNQSSMGYEAMCSFKYHSSQAIWIKLCVL